MKTTFKKSIIGIALAVIVCFTMTGFFTLVQKNVKSKINESRGLFSWKGDVFKDGGKELFLFMNQHGFTELYQWFEDELDDSDITAFLKNAKKDAIDIYMLTGDPHWAEDSDAKSHLKRVLKAEQINKQAQAFGIKGIVIDTEPYLLDNWKRNKKKIMSKFTSGMKKTYSAATSKGLEMIICIPYYYDEEGFRSELKTLISDGCDRVAVMNYYKGKEADHISNEAKYAERYGKGIINIYEFKKVEENKITEEITYHTDGFDAALNNFNELKKTYPNAQITMAAHDYATLREVLK